MKRILPFTSFIFAFSMLLISCEPTDAVDPFFIAHEKSEQDESGIGAAIGVKNLSWKTDSWSIAKESYDGKESVQSGNYGGGRATSSLSTTITGPCRVSFFFQRNFYKGRFAVMCDSTCLYSLSGIFHNSWGWHYCQVSVPAGNHVLSFVYTHPGMGWRNEFNGIRIDAMNID